MNAVLVDVALAITERRAKILRNMKNGLLKKDVKSVLECACDLCGVDQVYANDCSRSAPPESNVPITFNRAEGTIYATK